MKTVHVQIQFLYRRLSFLMTYLLFLSIHINDRRRVHLMYVGNAPETRRQTVHGDAILNKVANLKVPPVNTHISCLLPFEGLVIRKLFTLQNRTAT